MGTSRPIRVLCARELQNSIAESVHRLLSDQIMLLGLGNFYDILKTSISGKNGTYFSFAGIKNNVNKIKSYEGIDYCWVEEANNVSKASWGVLIPTIVRRASAEIVMTFNPELDTDYTYIRFVRDYGATGGGLVESEDAFVVKMTWRDNPWLSEGTKEEIERDRKRDYDYYLNVWEGHTIQQLEGAIYAKELRRAQEEDRICSVPYDREVPVDVSWDLGRADSTCLWFTQRVAMQWRVLAYYEASQEDISHYLRELQSRGYVYGQMNLPHDAKAKQLGTKHSIEEIVRQAGYRVTIVPKLSLVDGINAVRLVLPNCFFDEEECEDGLKALRHYRYRVHDGHLSNDPLHDWASHGADAFRSFAVAAKSGLAGGELAGGVASRLVRKVSKFVERAPGLGWMQ